MALNKQSSLLGLKFTQNMIALYYYIHLGHAEQAVDFILRSHL